jgi:hypothetical protein
MKKKKIISLIIRLFISIILLQTLFYKFTAHPDSIHIFSTLGVEPWGRIGLGIVELIVALLILIPSTKLIGILCSLGIMMGAIFSHFLVIGVNVGNDGGSLFSLAVFVFLSSLVLLFMYKKDFEGLCKCVFRKN